MPDALKTFFQQDPFWAVIMLVLMVLPILGAIAWVVLRAFKKYDKDENSF